MNFEQLGLISVNDFDFSLFIDINLADNGQQDFSLSHKDHPG